MVCLVVFVVCGCVVIWFVVCGLLLIVVCGCCSWLSVGGVCSLCVGCCASFDVVRRLLVGGVC